VRFPGRRGGAARQRPALGEGRYSTRHRRRNHGPKPPRLIPFCHPLGLENCRIHHRPRGRHGGCSLHGGVQHKNGVEWRRSRARACRTDGYVCAKPVPDIRIGDLRLLARTAAGAATPAGRPRDSVYGLISAAARVRACAGTKAALRTGAKSQLDRAFEWRAGTSPGVVSVRATDHRPDARPTPISWTASRRRAMWASVRRSRRTRTLLALLACELPFFVGRALSQLLRERDRGFGHGLPQAHDACRTVVSIWSRGRRRSLPTRTTEPLPAKILFLMPVPLLGAAGRTRARQRQYAREYAMALATLDASFLRSHAN